MFENFMNEFGTFIFVVSAITGMLTLAVLDEKFGIFDKINKK